MLEKEPAFYNYSDFLKNTKFIEWRLLKTEELATYWSDFIISHPECKNAFEEAIVKFQGIKLYHKILSEDEQNSLYSRIIKDIEYRKKRSRRLRLYYMSAACVAVLLLILILVPKKILTYQDKYSEPIIGTTLPSENVQLVSGGKIIELDQNALVELSDNGLASVSDKYNEKENVKLNTEIMNKLVVPYGKRSTLVLSDGTKIWLNSGTEVEFPSGFSGKTRNIKVKGEIYLEVAEMKGKPFCVHTPQLDVQVLGTKFNISDYADSHETAVVLAEGKVEVKAKDYKSSMILSPNEMFSIDNGQVRMSKVNVWEHISWKDGILIVNKIPISELLKTIGRYYNVEFENLSSAELSKRSCTGKLVLTDDFDSIMTAISVLTSTAYNRDNETIYINNME